MNGSTLVQKLWTITSDDGEVSRDALTVRRELLKQGDLQTSGPA